MSYSLQLTIPYLPPLNTSATRRHWAVQAREARQIKSLVLLLAARKAPPDPLPRARVVCTRHSANEPDPENLALGFKAVIDGLVAAGVIVNDSPRFLSREYRWESAPRGKGFLTLDCHA